MEIKTFRDLIAWQRAMTLVKEVYKATSLMPDTERYGLLVQMRRAAVSIPSNIAEGHGRQSLPDYLRFLRVARGSLMELQTQIQIATDLGFLTPTAALVNMQEETDRVLQGLIRSLEKLSEDPRAK